MMQLYATGRKLGTTAVFLWGHGNFKYEIESLTATPGITKCEVFESTYEEAMKKFEKMVDKVRMV